MTDERKSPFGIRRPEYLNRLHEQLEELVADRDQLGQLLHVTIGIGSELDLDATLRRIVGAALTMTGTRYGALGVWGADGTLSSFVHHGIDAEMVNRIGHLPVGKGVLGVMRERDEPLRLADLAGHPNAVGFPEHHPPMKAFLGMPIIIRGATYGGLYVADDRPDFSFTAADEVTVRALASAASVAIDNARLYEQARTSAQWNSAGRAITASLLSGGGGLHPLELIAQQAMELTDAEQAIVLVPFQPDEGDDVDTLVVSAAVGEYADEVLGQRVPIEDSTSGEVFTSGRSVTTETFRRPIQAFTDVGERPAILMPLRSGDSTLGVIAVARNASQSPFDDAYLDLVSDFANHAAIALTLANARDRAQELMVLSDRDRIARDMHDHVIQRIFAVGLDLQSIAGRIRSDEIGQRIGRCIDDLQGVIDHMRQTIFDLHHEGATRHLFSQRIQDTIARLTDDHDAVTSIHLSGPLNVVAGSLADDAEAVVVEALSNAVRHSGAATITVDIAVGDELIVIVTDDGHGIPEDNQRHSGLANMAQRAEKYGGHCRVDSSASGTNVRFTAPLSAEMD